MASKLENGEKILLMSREKEHSFFGKGRIMVRYQKYQHPTFFSVHIFHPGEELPVKVHVGTRAYIDGLWKKLKL